MLDALIFFGTRGVAPIKIPQSIASGLLGRSAYSGGWKSAALGVTLHFFIAAVMSAVFYFASLKLPLLIRRPAFWGMVYGVAAYFVMNYLVLPMSAVVPRPGSSMYPFINGVVGHALLVGLPIGVIAKKARE